MKLGELVVLALSAHSHLKVLQQKPIRQIGAKWFTMRLLPVLHCEFAFN